MNTLVETVSKTICKSGKFETGEGCCAPICMENLGCARDKCTRCVDVHGDLARDIIDAIVPYDWNFFIMKETLQTYKEQYCEGWCEENGGFYEDCGGCLARKTLMVSQ